MEITGTKRSLHHGATFCSWSVMFFRRCVSVFTDIYQRVLLDCLILDSYGWPLFTKKNEKNVILVVEMYRHSITDPNQKLNNYPELTTVIQCSCLCIYVCTILWPWVCGSEWPWVWGIPYITKKKIIINAGTVELPWSNAVCVVCVCVLKCIFVYVTLNIRVLGVPVWYCVCVCQRVWLWIHALCV